MYVPPHFRIEGNAAGLDCIGANPFGTLISVRDGSPQASHLPFVVLQSEPEIVLGAHFAKANDHWRSIDAQEVLTIFSGAHGYISPRWYADRTRNVPTWNYAVTHVRGVARIAAPEELEEILRCLIGTMEGEASGAWSMDELDARYATDMKQAIVGIRITVSSLTTKLKFSQNQSGEVRSGLIAGLREDPSPTQALLAQAMAALFD